MVSILCQSVGNGQFEGHPEVSLPLLIWSGQVSDCCFNTRCAVFTYYISWRQEVTCRWYGNDICFALDQHTNMGLYSASSLKQQSEVRQDAPLWHSMPIPSQPIFALAP
jgi:hypothetical protein